MVFPGMVTDKAAAIETIGQVEPWATFELFDIRTSTDRSAGLITYRARPIEPDTPPTRL